MITGTGRGLGDRVIFGPYNFDAAPAFSDWCAASLLLPIRGLAARIFLFLLRSGGRESGDTYATHFRVAACGQWVLPRLLGALPSAFLAGAVSTDFPAWPAVSFERVQCTRWQRLPCGGWWLHAAAGAPVDAGAWCV